MKALFPLVVDMELEPRRALRRGLHCSPLGLFGENEKRKHEGSGKAIIKDCEAIMLLKLSEMHHLPDEFLGELKNQIKTILKGNGGSQNREEFLILQKFVQSRSNLIAKTLIRAHRAQLEILVAINMGIQALMHPNISLSQASLIKVFVYKTYINIACQNQLPADDCTREIDANRNFFCNLCPTEMLFCCRDLHQTVPALKPRIFEVPKSLPCHHLRQLSCPLQLWMPHSLYPYAREEKNQSPTPPQSGALFWADIVYLKK